MSFASNPLVIILSRFCNNIVRQRNSIKASLAPNSLGDKSETLLVSGEESEDMITSEEHEEDFVL
jgi:hypothetical protein